MSVIDQDKKFFKWCCMKMFKVHLHRYSCLSQNYVGPNDGLYFNISVPSTESVVVIQTAIKHILFLFCIQFHFIHTERDLFMQGLSPQGLNVVPCVWVAGAGVL